MQTRTLESGDLTAYVHDSAPGVSDEAIVFVHGNPGPMDDFEVLAREAARFSRVVALDMPAFGRASHIRLEDFQVSSYARYLNRVLDALEVRRAHLVLHDFGGLWGLAWAAEHPEQVASLTLINTGHCRDYRWHSFARIWQTPGVGELFQLMSVRAMIRWVMNRDNPRPLPDEFLARVSRYATLRQKLAVLGLYRQVRDPEVLADAVEAPLKALQVPVCVLWGADDSYIPRTMAERQRDVFPQAEVHVLEGLGHWPFIDDPDAVLAHLRPFWERCVAQDSTGLHA